MSEFQHCGICGALDHDTWDGHLEDEVRAACDHAECLWPGECQDYTPAPMTEAEHVAAAYAHLGL